MEPIIVKFLKDYPMIYINKLLNNIETFLSFFLIEFSIFFLIFCTMYEGNASSLLLGLLGILLSKVSHHLSIAKKSNELLNNVIFLLTKLLLYLMLLSFILKYYMNFLDPSYFKDIVTTTIGHLCPLSPKDNEACL